MKRKIIFIMMLILVVMNVFSISYGFELNELGGTASAETKAGLLNAGNNIVAIITTIGIVISVVMLVVLGIKYMLGSVEEKAEYKKTLIPYMIGASFVFAASIIVQIIYEVAIQL